jgi:hypothetical protein
VSLADAAREPFVVYNREEYPDYHRRLQESLVMPEQNDVYMKHKLEKDDYLDLWKYFDDKATSVKGAMFSTITWIIGFAGALLGFIFVKLADFDLSKASIPLSWLFTSISIAGILICVYAFFALGESAKHIKNNWGYADKICRDNIEGLREIVLPEKVEKKDKLTAIWYQLGIVVLLFLVAFVVILAFGALNPALGPRTQERVVPIQLHGSADDELKLIRDAILSIAPRIERLKLSGDLVNQIPKIIENLDTTRSAAQQATAAGVCNPNALSLNSRPAGSTSAPRPRSTTSLMNSPTPGFPS